MPNTKTARCTKCDYKEEYEPDEEFGLTFFQTDGSCPLCGADLVDKKGNPTKEVFEIKLTDKK